MESHLPAFKASNPQLEVVTELIRGQHPHLKGLYSKFAIPSSPPACILHLYVLVCLCMHTCVFHISENCFLLRESFATCLGNKNERVICVKNLTPEEIHLHATRLRNALGRKVVKLKTRHVTKHPSVQGTWSTALKFWGTRSWLKNVLEGCFMVVFILQLWQLHGSNILNLGHNLDIQNILDVFLVWIWRFIYFYFCCFLCFPSFPLKCGLQQTR